MKCCGGEGRLTYSSDQDIVWGHSVEEYRVNNVWSCTFSLTYVFVVCTGTTKCYIYQIVLTLSLYILTCYIYDFLSLHSLGNWNMFVSSWSQNIVIIKLMFVSLLCVTLLDWLNAKMRDVYKKKKKVDWVLLLLWSSSTSSANLLLPICYISNYVTTLVCSQWQVHSL